MLKLHHYLGPDVNTAVIDAVLEALMVNQNCQALYIQNFNEGFREEQVSARGHNSFAAPAFDLFMLSFCVMSRGVLLCSSGMAIRLVILIRCLFFFSVCVVVEKTGVRFSWKWLPSPV